MADIVNIGFRINTADIDKGYKRLGKMGEQAEKTENRVVKATGEMSSSFSLLTGNVSAVTSAFAALATSSGLLTSINSNKEFAKSVSSLSAITGAVGEDLEFYKQQAAEIGSTTTLSASQAVTAFKLIASAKPDLLASKEALADVAREAVILSEATGGELALADAASALGGALNQFQLDATEARDVVNLLAEASRSGSADVVMISDSLVNVGAAANAMGVSITETVAGLEALAAGEIKGSEAGTGLRQVLIGLEKTGKSDLMPSVVGLTKAVENYAAMNLSTTETIKMFGAEGLAAASTIIAQIDTLSSLSSTLDGTNTAYAQAATQVNNLDGDLKSLNSVIESISISIGQELDPSMREAVQSITALLSNTEGLSNASKTFASVIAISLVPATVKYTASLYSQVSAQLLANTQAVRTVNALGQVTIATGTATVATNALTMATRFLLGPWGLLLSAVTAAGIAYSLTNDEVEEQNKSLDDQLKVTDKLLKSVKGLTEIQKSNAALKAQLELVDLKAEQEKLEAEILTHQFDENQIASLTLNTNDKLTKNKERQIRLQRLLAELQKGSDDSNDTQDKTNDKLEGQLASIRKMTEQLSMTEEQRFVDDQVRKAKERGDTEAQIELVRGLSQAYLDAKKEQENFADLISGTDTVDLFALNQSKDYDKWIESISTTSTQISALRAEIEKTKGAIDAGDLSSNIGEEYITDLKAQIQELDINPFESMTNGAQDALSAMSGMFESGSKDAQKLAIAMQALNLVQAVGAVLNQGKGDPYTAFGRMAAMAAMVASLGVSIGNLGGDFQDESQQNQASQGLNVWGEKSESILEATEITAGATEKLVGINTNMLKSMQGLTVALSSAAGMIVRDTTIPTASVSVRENLFEGLQDFFSGDILNLTGLLGETFTNLLNLPLNIIGNWLGGSSSVTDEGIRILGGTFNELMDDVTVQAFQSVKYKKWKFGSSKSKTVFQDAGDEVGQQFALVFESIANSVAVGAEALGLSASEIEKRINEFEVATTTISLRGLSAEDQKKEIEAVFSQIFSDLAGDVVPFAKDFQQVGEDLGTTLARLASQVAVTEEITARFGINFGDKFADPEAYASAADNLATLVGGVEELAEKTSSFTNAFATDAQLFDIYQRAMDEALNEVGLTLPSTSEGLYDLMMSLDGTTEAGREQIATLLGLTDTASEYFKLLDKTAGAYRKAAEGLFDITEASRAMSLESALAAARLGDFSLAEQLDLGSIAPSTSDFNTALEYNLARAETAARLNELADLQSGQISVEDKQLTVLEEIRDKLGDSDTMNDEVKKELMELRIQMSKQQTESNDYLRRMAYQGAE